MSAPSDSNLETTYRKYIQMILNHDLDRIADYVSSDVIHNGQKLGLVSYRELLFKNIVETGMHIEIKRLIADGSHVAALLIFTTTKLTRSLVGIPLKDEIFSYAENVFYDFKDGKIVEVHSLFDIDTVRGHARESDIAQR